MSAHIKCKACGRETHARVIEDDHSINSFVLQDDIDWKDADQEEPTTCPHEEYDVLGVEYDDGPD